MFEVMVSGLIIAVGVLASLALFPESLKQQQIARQRVFASMIAMDLMNVYNEGSWLAFKRMQSEPHLMRSTYAPDFDRAAAVGLMTSIDGHRGTQMEVLVEPVPPAILARLDSENDEIAELVRMGAPIYYAMPSQGFIDAFVRDDLQFDASDIGTSDLDQNEQAVSALIFGVVGYPQQNAMFHAPSTYDYAHMGSPDSHHGSAGHNLWLRHGRYASPDWWRWRSTFIRQDLGEAVWHAGAHHGFFWEVEAQMVNAWSEWPYQANRDAARFDHGDDTDLPYPLLRYETNSLYMPFQANERARQLVFWAVNWKSYEDFETVPAVHADIARWCDAWAGRGTRPHWQADRRQQLYRSDWLRPLDHEYPVRFHRENGTRTDRGYWDRNFDDEKTTGNIPRTTRLRARTIARFNFYDRRLIMTY